MCAGRSVMPVFARLVYGASDAKGGAVETECAFMSKKLAIGAQSHVGHLSGAVL